MSDYELVAVKRRWVPEWLWWAMGNWPVYQPFRWLLTTSKSDERRTVDSDGIGSGRHYRDD